MSATIVGRVAALLRYPVKSMAAEPLERVQVSWHGLAGDRRWAFIRADQVRSGFPWLTIRERPDLIHHRASFVVPESVETSATVVHTPAGEQFDVVDPDLAAALGDVRVIRQSRGVFDEMPLSLITIQSLDNLGALLGRKLEGQRFRPNLIVDAQGDAAFPEDAWVGSVLALGDLRMRVDQRDKRCVVVNVDPVTTKREPLILRAIARERQACLGVYGTTIAPGVVSVGDAVTLLGDV